MSEHISIIICVDFLFQIQGQDILIPGLCFSTNGPDKVCSQKSCFFSRKDLVNVGPSSIPNPEGIKYIYISPPCKNCGPIWIRKDYVEQFKQLDGSREASPSKEIMNNAM